MNDLIMLGDRMQSEGARMAEWILGRATAAPYEVQQAAFQFLDDVTAWTELRRSTR